LQPCRVVIETQDGRKLEKRVDYAMGDPRLPIDPAALDAKFSAQAEGLLSKAKQQKLKEAIFQIERVKTVGEVLQLTVKDR
jgi:2-methylcitrate dehydratase PrpD